MLLCTTNDSLNLFLQTLKMRYEFKNIIQMQKIIEAEIYHEIL